MPRARKSQVPFPFGFPNKPYCRIHGPRGHKEYQAYKLWLRDEFEFRCVYCLTRERWSGDGPNRFSIDHVQPKSLYPHLICEYDNLVYACTTCNMLKSQATGLPDPCQTGLEKHLRLKRNGEFEGRTPEGKRLIAYLRLNSAGRKDERTKKVYAYETQGRVRKDILQLEFGYPEDLPDLAKLKPPNGNTRPKGIHASHLARKRRKELPLYY